MNFKLIDINLKTNLSPIGYIFMLLQVVFFLIVYIYRSYFPERFEHFVSKYLFFEKSDKNSMSDENQELDKDILNALVKAYEHPWYKLEERVKSVNDRKSWIKKISSKTAPYVSKN